MQQYDPRHDAYIAKAAPFAQPILTHLRQLVHQAVPEIQETVKWSMPFFDCQGLVCQMAAFKQHCTFGFWKGSLLTDPYQILNIKDDNAMGQLGRITSLADLPSDEILMQYIWEAVKLNQDGVKTNKPKPVAKELVVPDYFTNLLKQHPHAEAQFNQYSYSHQKEYVEWITEAKTEPTRQKRMQTAIEWLSEGKSRHWKYQK
jgi:uncharacterized protein YdeI (YjbR/CyaY-like superfamily)